MEPDKRGEIATLFVIGAFVVATAFTVVSSLFNQSKQIVKTKAQVATPRDDSLQDQSPCPNDGEWRIKCTGERGPCESNAGVGIPYRCGYGVWNTTNPIGECNLSCKIEEQAPQSPQAPQTQPGNSDGDIVVPQNYCPNEGEWKIECIKDQGPCEANAGVGVPYHCENNAWNPKQSECNTKCVVKTNEPPTPTPTLVPQVTNTCVVRVGAESAFIQKGEAYCDANSVMYICDGSNVLTPINCGEKNLVCIQDQGTYNARCDNPPVANTPLSSDPDPCIANPQSCAGAPNSTSVTFTAKGKILNRGRGSFSDLYIKMGTLSHGGILRYIGTPDSMDIDSNGNYQTTLTMSKNEALVFAEQCTVYIFNRQTNEALGSDSELKSCVSDSPMQFNAQIEYPFTVPEPTATTAPSPTPTYIPQPTYNYGEHDIQDISPTPVPPTLAPTPTDIPYHYDGEIGRPDYFVSDSVTYWSEVLSGRLEPGKACDGGYCRMVKKVTNGSYESRYREGLDDGVGSTGRYWCTTFARDSFTLAGKIGPNTESVAQMVGAWEDTKSSVYYPYFKSADKAKVLKSVYPGCMFFDETAHRTHTGNEHVAVLQAVNIYNEANGVGEVVTLDGNRKDKVQRYSFVDWKIQDNKYNFVSFGCF